MSNVVVIVVNGINVDILRNQTKLRQYLARVTFSNKVYYVYCKHKCAVKVNVVYVMK